MTLMRNATIESNEKIIRKKETHKLAIKKQITKYLEDELTLEYALSRALNFTKIKLSESDLRKPKVISNFNRSVKHLENIRELYEENEKKIFNLTFRALIIESSFRDEYTMQEVEFRDNNTLWVKASSLLGLFLLAI